MRGLILTLLAACTSQDWNAADVCIENTEPPTFRVSATHRCIDCLIDGSIVCTVTKDNNEILVDSKTTWRSWPTCFTRTCAELTTTCTGPALEPGRYTFKHGARQRVIDLPSRIADPCTPWHDPHN